MSTPVSDKGKVTKSESKVRADVVVLPQPKNTAAGAEFSAGVERILLAELSTANTAVRRRCCLAEIPPRTGSELARSDPERTIAERAVLPRAD